MTKEKRKCDRHLAVVFFCRGSQMGRKLEKMQVASRMRFALTSSDEGGEIGLRYGAEQDGANLGQDSVDPR